MAYPKWLYHPAKEARIVADEAAEKALGHGWYETPADFPPGKVVEAPDEEVAPAPKPKKAAK